MAVGMNGFMLGVILGGIAWVASAVPPAIATLPSPLYPLSNATTPTSTVADATTCGGQCSVYYPQLSAISWVPTSQIVYTTTITVATVEVSIGIVGNKTYAPITNTVYKVPFPTGYSLFMLSPNDEGTVVLSYPVTKSDGSIAENVLTFPTPYLDYSTEYHWEGALGTHDKAHNPACATATGVPANVPLPNHPDYPQPTQVPAVNVGDNTLGYDHQPLWVPIAEQPDKSFFDAVFTTESAFGLCQSAPRHTSVLTQFHAPKFVTVTTTITETPKRPEIGHIMSSATGWEEQTRTRPNMTPQISRVQTTVPGFNSPSTRVAPTRQVETSTTRVGGGGQAQQTDRDRDQPKTTQPPTIGEVPGGPASAPTPVFTFVTTVREGQTTTIPAYILPGSSETATLGQTVTLNGQPTVLAAPPALFTVVPTVIDGTSTSVPAYLIHGTSTATLGQTVTLNGQPTVLAAPPPLFTVVPTVVDGTSTSLPAYIIDGTSTATLGQTVTLNGQTTVLSPPPAILTWFSTTIGGRPTSSPGFIISGSSTATIGQTVVINSTTTVLSVPTTAGLSTGLVPAATSAGGSAGGAQPTGLLEGAGAESSWAPWGGALAAVAAVVILFL